jgi:ribonuclease-3
VSRLKMRLVMADLFAPFKPLSPADVPVEAVVQAGLLAAKLGLDLAADGLLARALVHRSWAFEHGGIVPNERLEFLGDAVLSLAVAEALYAWLPHDHEGKLAKVRGQAVRESELADVGRAIGLGSHVLLGVGEAASGGSDKDSILADAFEAVLGAVHAEGGWQASRSLVEQLMGERLRMLANGEAILDHKTALQEWLASEGRGEPTYRWTAEGPDHAKTFTAEAVVGGEVLGIGTGTSKKRAEESAAAFAWRSLDTEPGAMTG